MLKPSIEDDLATESYDPYADAIAKGITVGFLPIDTAHGTWLPRERTIILSTRITDPAERRSILTHMIAHADLEGSSLMRRYRKGCVSMMKVERKVRREASRRLVTLPALAEALNTCESAHAEDVAAALNITVRKLACRVRATTPREMITVGAQLALLEWPTLSPADTQICVIGNPGQVIEPTLAGVAKVFTHAGIFAIAAAIAIHAGPLVAAYLLTDTTDEFVSLLKAVSPYD